MDTGTLILMVVTGLLAVLSGWLIPIIFKSRRPYGVLGDILVSLVVAVGLAYVEWTWLLPAIGFEKRGWLTIAATVGSRASALGPASSSRADGVVRPFEG
jgi:uncharacterized membrane protein YeaQ/YmgE (transglycosylase-associated protein family)